MANLPFIIDLAQHYTLISVNSVSNGKQILLDLFSFQPLWIMCIKPCSLSLLQSFTALNKNFHYSSSVLLFSKPESIRNRLGLKHNKDEIYWVKRENREELFEYLNIPQLPWVIAFEEGKIIYSSQGFPESFNGSHIGNKVHQKISNFCADKSRKLRSFEDQVNILKKRIKKHEKKEIEYRGEITDLNDQVKTFEIEVKELRIKRNEAKIKLSLTPLPFTKERLIDFQAHISESPIKYNLKDREYDDFWKKFEDNDAHHVKNISRIKDLWVNNFDKSIRKNIPNKLFPIISDRNNSTKHRKKNYILQEKIFKNIFNMH